MTLSPPTRKRSRSCEEEDFLPLSKKINNLHLNNWGKLTSSQQQLLKWSNPSSSELINLYSTSELSNENRREGNESNNTATSSHFKNSRENHSYNETELIRQQFKIGNNTDSFKNNSYSNDKYGNCESSNLVVENYQGQTNWTPVYNPDLDINENPFYYESNKLLFDLYVARLQRNGF